MTLCGILCGADDWNAIAYYAREKVAFNEDQSRARQGFAAENLATARQIALNLLKQDTTAKIGIKNRRIGCGWSERYLEHVLGLIIK